MNEFLTTCFDYISNLSFYEILIFLPLGIVFFILIGVIFYYLVRWHVYLFNALFNCKK